MNETNGTEISDGLRPVLFWEQHDVSSVDDVEVGRRQFRESVDGPYEIVLDDIPARAEKGDGKTIRARGLIRWHVINRLLDLEIGER
jgi:hypothetical protein